MASIEHTVSAELHSAEVHVTLVMCMRAHATGDGATSCLWSLAWRAADDKDAQQRHFSGEVLSDACLRALRTRLAAETTTHTGDTTLARATLEMLDEHVLPYGTRCCCAVPHSCDAAFARTTTHLDDACTLQQQHDDACVLTLCDEAQHVRVSLALKRDGHDDGARWRAHGSVACGAVACEDVCGDVLLFCTTCSGGVDDVAPTTRVLLADDEGVQHDIAYSWPSGAPARGDNDDATLRATRTCRGDTTPCTVHMDEVWTSMRTLSTYATAVTCTTRTRSDGKSVCNNNDDDDGSDVCTYVLRALPASRARECASLLAPGLVECLVLVEGDVAVGDGGAAVARRQCVRGCMLHRGYAAATMTATLQRVAARVHAALRDACPDAIDAPWLRDVLLRHDDDDSDVMCEAAWQCDALVPLMRHALMQPLRTLVERGGSGWRSGLLHTCCHAVCHDDDSALPMRVDCTPLMVFVELLQVGSLIVDDVEDAATQRRGGACVHALYGMPLAVNAGTFAYFAAPRLARLRATLPRDVVARVLAINGDLLRIGHLGQGIDIDGLHTLVPAVVARSGDDDDDASVHTLRAALRCVFAYKTGSLCAAVCRMACAMHDGIATDGAASRTRAMATFGTALGVAYQIANDAGAVRSAAHAPAALASDVATGKVTAPMVEALARLRRDDREALWRLMQARDTTPDALQRLVRLLERADATACCVRDARAVVNDAWRSLAPLLRNTRAKLLLRSLTLAIVS